MRKTEFSCHAEDEVQLSSGCDQMHYLSEAEICKNDLIVYVSISTRGGKIVCHRQSHKKSLECPAGATAIPAFATLLMTSHLLVFHANP